MQEPSMEKKIKPVHTPVWLKMYDMWKHTVNKPNSATHDWVQ